jgi:hypothetical protein
MRLTGRREFPTDVFAGRSSCGFGGTEVFVCSMKGQIEKLLRAMPFEPFAVEISDTVMHAIPTRDHVLVAKNGLFFLGDDGLVDFVTWPHVRRLSFREAVLG